MAKVATADARRFMEECLKAAGAPEEAAEQQAAVLMEAERLGHPSHGMNILEFYINNLLKGSCKPNNQPRVLKETASTAWVDADNVLGPTASHFAMDIAIKKAKETGIGWVTGQTTSEWREFGPKKAADEGLIGMAFTNSAPAMAPTRSKKAAPGTNPISVVAPGSNGEILYIDMATTVISYGKIRQKGKQNGNIPGGCALGPDGKETTDAELALNTRCLMPLGGAEHTSGYKGYCLAAMVELFCGISSGSEYGHHVRSWAHSEASHPLDLGHCFMALDPGCFAPGFGDRLADSMQHWRQLEPTDPSLPVLAPGDKEKEAARRSDESGTVSYAPQQLAASAALAQRLKVKPMTVLD